MYKKVEYHNLISSFSKRINVKASKGFFTSLKVKMAGSVATPAGDKFFNVLGRHHCTLVRPIVNKLKNLGLLGKSEIYH